MSVPVCARCDGDVEVSNRTFPGYCSPWCRDTDRADRQSHALVRRQQRAARRERRAARPQAAP